MKNIWFDFFIPIDDDRFFLAQSYHICRCFVICITMRQEKSRRSGEIYFNKSFEFFFAGMHRWWSTNFFYCHSFANISQLCDQYYWLHQFGNCARTVKLHSDSEWTHRYCPQLLLLGKIWNNDNFRELSLIGEYLCNLILFYFFVNAYVICGLSGWFCSDF